MKNVLLMGGTTFISEALAKYLISKEYEVDILTRGGKTLKYTGYKNHLICDRKNEEALKETLKDKIYDYVCDISAYTGEDVRILISSLNKESIKKYLFISSAAVYEKTNEVVDEDATLTKSTDWGTYAVDKIDGENELIKSNLPYIIFRPPYIYGEGNNLYREAYIYDSILNEREIPIPNGKDVRVQFLYIKDLVKYFEDGLNSKTTGIFNIGEEKTYSFLEYVTLCGEALNKKAKTILVDTTKYSKDVRSFFPFREVNLALSVEKLKNSDIYSETTSLIDGLKEAFKWIEEEKPCILDKRMINIYEAINFKED